MNIAALAGIFNEADSFIRNGRRDASRAQDLTNKLEAYKGTKSLFIDTSKWDVAIAKMVRLLNV